MNYLGILTFGVVILTIPTLLGAGIAFLLTRQQKNISIMWRFGSYQLLSVALQVDITERTEYVRKIVANHGGMKMKPYIISYRK